MVVPFKDSSAHSYESGRGLLDYGCKCQHHKECLSQYCCIELGRCTEMVIQGAVALDAVYSSLHAQVMEAISKGNTIGRHCDQENCEDSDSKMCRTR